MGVVVPHPGDAEPGTNSTCVYSRDISNIFFNFYNCIKRCWKSGCLVCQAFLLEAPDALVHRSWTQLKQVICVKCIMPRLRSHWLRAHQASPSSPSVVKRVPERSLFIFVIVPLIYFLHSTETGQWLLLHYELSYPLTTVLWRRKIYWLIHL